MLGVAAALLYGWWATRVVGYFTGRRSIARVGAAPLLRRGTSEPSGSLTSRLEMRSAVALTVSVALVAAAYLADRGGASLGQWWPERLLGLVAGAVIATACGAAPFLHPYELRRRSMLAPDHNWDAWMRERTAYEANVRDAQGRSATVQGSPLLSGAERAWTLLVVALCVVGLWRWVDGDLGVAHVIGAVAVAVSFASGAWVARYVRRAGHPEGARSWDGGDWNRTDVLATELLPLTLLAASTAVVLLLVPSEPAGDLLRFAAWAAVATFVFWSLANVVARVLPPWSPVRPRGAGPRPPVAAAAEGAAANPVAST